MTEIRYPFDEVPEKSQIVDVAPGVKWLRMPLPMALDHVNLYLIDAGDHWVVVDTGMNIDNIRSLWEQVLEQDLFENKPIGGVVVTHMHPDHVGLAGWLCERFRVPLYMSRSEYLNARALSTMTPGLSWTSRQYFERLGQTESFLNFLEKSLSGFAAVVSRMPGGFHRLTDGQCMELGGQQWQVVIGCGHSYEHVCLHNKDQGILLAGDQVIPKISSNVSVMATEPEANPLKDWLESIQKFKSLPSDTLVLPAHNRPFYGLHARLDELTRHHEDHLAAIEEACVQPKTATELLPVLFQREIDYMQMGMAVGECVAHLHFMMAEGQIERSLDDEGIYHYRTLDSLVADRPHKRHGYMDDEQIMV